MATNFSISENQERISLGVRAGGLRRTIHPDSGNPYYVGARAYVTKEGNKATITIIDKDGTTTADVFDGTDGTTNYNDMTNKPQIEGVTLSGNKTYDQLNLQRLTNSEIEEVCQ